jgi:UDP-N-acetylmuramate dehydrogenase
VGDRAVEALRAVIADPACVEAGVRLAGLTTMRIGGPAGALVRAETVDDLVAAAAVGRDLGLPWLVVGRGSNLLVADDGWPGIVIVLGRGFRGVDIDGELVRVGAAEPMPALANTVAKAGLAGLAFGVAIPGTLGGAVRMNAGAHGQEMRDVLEWAEVVRMGGGGAVERWDAPRLAFDYRHSALAPDAIVIRAQVRLHRADAADLAAEMAEFRQWRRDHQPINEPSCGSVFRNPPGTSAGRLIEAAGLKGFGRGSAEVSEHHANFITVRPGARAADVHAIIREVQRRVEQTTGVRLRTEVVLAGFDDDTRDHGGDHVPSAEVAP